MLAVDYQLCRQGPFSTTASASFINQNQSRVIMLYQFYAVLGGVAALYMPQARAFVLRHGRLVVAGFALGLALIWGNSAATAMWHKNIGYGISVFQPAMVIYAIGVATFLYWLAYALGDSPCATPATRRGILGLALQCVVRRLPYPRLYS